MPETNARYATGKRKTAIARVWLSPGDGSIIVNGKRNEHALAVDRAAEWLQTFPEAARTDEGIGVRFELAKNILAQLPELNDNDKQVALRRATDLLGEQSQLGSNRTSLGITPQQQAYLRSRAETIYGGSSQVQRNLVAERILGLPR